MVITTANRVHTGDRYEVFEQICAAESLDLGRPSRWLSLACGSALHVLDAAAAVLADGGATPKLTVVDPHQHTLDAAQLHAAVAGMESPRLYRMNVRGMRGIVPQSPLAHFQPPLPGGYDLVECVQQLDRLPLDDETTTLGSTRGPQAGARTFLSNAFDLVRPGGVLVTGSTTPAHGQPDIQTRDVDTMLTLLTEAGLVGDRHVYLAEHNAFALYTVRKP